MYLDKLKNNLKDQTLVGCTNEEVVELETKLNCTLPEAYKEFLLLMGKSAGNFLKGSDCFYEHLLNLKEWAIEILKENNVRCDLPEDAFVFYMHQGYQFSFFRLSDEDDPPVYHYFECYSSFLKNETFTTFLEVEYELYKE